MIDAKQAVALAKQSAEEMFSRDDVSLEEIERELYRGRDVWSVTLAFPAKLPEDLLGFRVDSTRYKRFLVDSENGEVVAIKMRETAVR